MGDPKAGAAFHSLVHQFSDPLAFYRELIQNAVDANSRDVDIFIDFSEPETLVVRVEDHGDGMTAEVIDRQLTRLFSSSKEGDLTKIGRFGIGFVSVFALQPQAVVVDTSRDDEHWRVVFEPNGSFARLARTEPVDGTRIRILKRFAREEVEDFRARTVEAVRSWCKHVEATVRVDGVVINEPFELSGCPCRVSLQEPGTRIVAGYARDFKPFTGFYNRGLTLLESRERHTWPNVVVKVDSRYLEHTFTRDEVLCDENFLKARELVERVVLHELPRAVLDRLEAAGPQDPERDYLNLAAARILGRACLVRYQPDDFSAGHGEAGEEGWSLRAGRHPPCLVETAPRELPEGKALRIGFRLLVPADRTVPGDTPVACLQALGPSGQVQAERRVGWRDLTAGQPEEFTLGPLAGPEKLTVRVAWEGKVSLYLQQVTLWLEEGGGGWKGHASRALFQTPEGRPVTLQEVVGAYQRGRLLVAPGPGPLTAALEARNHLVLRASPGEGTFHLLEALLEGPAPLAQRRYCLPVAVPEPEGAAWRRLARGLERLTGLKARPASLHCDRVLVAQRKFGELTPLNGGEAEGHRVLAVNLTHPALAPLLGLAETEPELAAFLLVRLGRLGGAELAARAWEERCRRPTS